ncbi:MAG: hypothetical protein H6741_20035 [Alphaproteobacteria bacterium]|nr:hypothetical protein [Alphaproteobacteria bacterium]
MLDNHDRWIHPRIGLAAPRPELLGDCDAQQLADFHDPQLWLDGERGPAPPHLEPELQRAVTAQELDWDGWVGAWLGPREVPFTLRDLQRLGAEGLERQLGRYHAWRSAQSVRTLVSCVGMGAMFVWLLTGWLLGVDVYLGGMAAIALVSWLWRPRSMPDGLWEGLDLDHVGRAQDAAIERLGEAWEPVLEAVETVLTPDGRLHMRALDRTISADALKEHFTPDGFIGILEVLIPVDELPDP